jgi:hypothetical protein
MACASGEFRRDGIRRPRKNKHADTGGRELTSNSAGSNQVTRKPGSLKSADSGSDDSGTSGQQLGNYPETGFEEIGAQVVFRRTAFSPTGLLARDYFRLVRHPFRIATIPVSGFHRRLAEAIAEKDSALPGRENAEA